MLIPIIIVNTFVVFVFWYQIMSNITLFLVQFLSWITLFWWHISTLKKVDCDTKRFFCRSVPLPGSAKLHTGSGMTKVDFYCAQMTSGVWGQWLSLCQVYMTAFRSRDIICDKIYGLKVGLHCFKELQFIGESETMQTNIVCWSAMAADKECVVVTTTAKSADWSTRSGPVWQGKLVHNRTNRFY